MTRLITLETPPSQAPSGLPEEEPEATPLGVPEDAPAPGSDEDSMPGIVTEGSPPDAG